jgi:hypothetical protein
MPTLKGSSMNMDQVRAVTTVEAAARALHLIALPQDEADTLSVFGTTGLIECTIARQNDWVSAWTRGQFYRYVKMFEEELALRQAA